MNRTTCLIVCCLLTHVTKAEEAPIAGKNLASTRVYVENRHLRVGVDLQLGGAITYVSQPGAANLINSFDLGRQIQQSYYSGPPNYQRQGKQKSPNWAGFPWNPIQTGDAYHNGSKVLEHRVRDGQLYVKTVPMLWPMNNDPGECVMETWITLSKDSPSFQYKARLSNARSDKTQYGPHPQEVPATYVNGPWHKLLTYAGDRPFSGAEPIEVRNDHHEPWPWVHFVATEGWAALINDAGTGIGVCTTKGSEFHGGFSGQRGSGGEKSANTGYMSPITTEILDHQIVYEYSCIMVLGTIQQIRAAAARVSPQTLPAWTFDTSRRGWTYHNGGDAGWPLAGRGLAPKATDISRPARLVGPFTFWRAEAAGQVALQVSSQAATTLKLFWRGMPTAAVASNSVWGPWQAQWWQPQHSIDVKIPAGSRQWVLVKLAGLPGYTGGMTGLAIDVPDHLAIHAVRLDAGDAPPH